MKNQRPLVVTTDTVAELMLDGYAMCTSCLGSTDHVATGTANALCDCGALALAGMTRLLELGMIVVPTSA